MGAVLECEELTHSKRGDGRARDTDADTPACGARFGVESTSYRGWGLDGGGTSRRYTEGCDQSENECGKAHKGYQQPAPREERDHQV